MAKKLLRTCVHNRTERQTCAACALRDELAFKKRGIRIKSPMWDTVGYALDIAILALEKNLDT